MGVFPLQTALFNRSLVFLVLNLFPAGWERGGICGEKV